MTKSHVERMPDDEPWRMSRAAGPPADGCKFGKLDSNQERSPVRAMTQTKPILALGLLGAGVATLLVGLHMQRDRYAFTSQPAQSSAAPTRGQSEQSRAAGQQPRTKPTASFAAARLRRDWPTGFAATPPVAGSLHASTLQREPEIPMVTLEALPVLPLNPPARRSTPAGSEDSVKDPPCNPKWRALESGPAGRIFRDICPAPGTVPRS